MKPSSDPDMDALSYLTPRFFPLNTSRLVSILIGEVKAYLVSILRGVRITCGRIACLARVHLFSGLLDTGSGSDSILITN
jgi:hypothetical protein